MLTYKDCVDATGLEEGAIEAIAQHEHLPEIVAAELGYRLAQQTGGEQIIDQMIRDDIKTAKQPETAMRWQTVLDRFESNHQIGTQSV